MRAGRPRRRDETSRNRSSKHQGKALGETGTLPQGWDISGRHVPVKPVTGFSAGGTTWNARDGNGPFRQPTQHEQGVNPSSKEQQRRKSNCFPALKLFCRFFSIQQTLNEKEKKKKNLSSVTKKNSQLFPPVALPHAISFGELILKTSFHFLLPLHRAGAIYYKMNSWESRDCHSFSCVGLTQAGERGGEGNKQNKYKSLAPRDPCQKDPAPVQKPGLSGAELRTHCRAMCRGWPAVSAAPHWERRWEGKSTRIL